MSPPAGGATLSIVVGTREPRNLESGDTARRDNFFDECRRVFRDPTIPYRRSLILLGSVAVVAGIALRFYLPSALWLDETISVNISKLPLTQIPEALSHDGAPPLYYVLLHFWMMIFGRGDFAVRAMSGVTSVIALPFFWQAGRRIGGRRTGWVLFFLAVASPFAIQYAATTRMYSLMILLSLLGFLALEHALEAPTRRHRIELGVVTAAILYTHYWGLYLVAVTGAWLVFRMIKERRAGLPDRWAIRPAFASMLIGSLFFLPWSPVFVFQTLHTGTPWTTSAGPADILGVFGDFAGSGPWGNLLGFGFVVLIILGLFGRSAVVAAGAPTPPSDPAADGAPIPLVHLVGRANPRVSAVAGILIGTLALSVVAGAIANAAFVARYAAVVLPLFLMLVALGISVLGKTKIVVGILVVACLAGLLTGLSENSVPRTQAVQVAQILNAEAQPGDLVVYCPDQLGPAVDRLLTVPGITELTYPRAIGPSRVDWVNYKQTIADTNPQTFAEQMLAQVGANHTLWVVERDGYPGFGNACSTLVSWLNQAKPTAVVMVHQNSRYYEYENLLRFPS
jgi:mannosyltransferase